MSITIFVNPKKEPEKYDIFQQLKQHGKAIIEDTNEKDWWKTISNQMAKISTKTENAILPPSTNRYHNLGFIVTKQSAIVKEEKIGKFIIDFKF